MKKLICASLLALAMSSCNQQVDKIAYVNNTKVVSDFKEMKAAQDKWSKKNNEVRASLEEKARQFQIEVQGYQTIMKSMTQGNREKKEQELRMKQQQLQMEQQTKMQEIQQGSQAEIDTIIKKVETFVKEYGKKNGYTYIFGETEVSNIWYAKEENDITDKILSELNSGDTTTSEVEATEEKKETPEIPEKETTTEEKK